VQGCIRWELEERATDFLSLDAMLLAGGLQDYYVVLGLDIEATRAEIKRAYRDLAKTYHPDKKNVNNKTFGEMEADLLGRRNSEAYDFRLIQTAWETLADADKRREYDGELVLARQEHAKIEKQLAKERARVQKRRKDEEKRRLRKEKKAADVEAREASLVKLAEMRAEEQFLEKLYNDKSGEDDTVALELQNLKELIAGRVASDPELDRLSNPEIGSCEPRMSLTNDPELEDITNLQTPTRSTTKGRRNAEVWSAGGMDHNGMEENGQDPELEPLSEQRSPSTIRLMTEIDRAIKMRLSEPRLSNPRLSLESLPFRAYKDPEV